MPKNYLFVIKKKDKFIYKMFTLLLANIKYNNFWFIKFEYFNKQVKTKKIRETILLIQKYS